MRLDAADQSWHLSTPAPYDPPLTYGGMWQKQRRRHRHGVTCTDIILFLSRLESMPGIGHENR